VLAVAGALRLEFPAARLLALGHSMGGTAAALAELTAPGTFSEGLVLVEPIFFSPAFAALERELDAPMESPLSARTRKRQRHFGSRAEAGSKLSGKPVLAKWEAEALVGYLQHGLMADGEGFSLRMNTEAEAKCYSLGFSAWDELRGIQCRSLLVTGEEC